LGSCNRVATVGGLTYRLDSNALRLRPNRAGATCKESAMEAVDHQTGRAEELHAAWTILDEASQVLVRAEALVLLIEQAHDLDEHHVYGAEIACGLLKTLKEKLSDAQDQIRSASLGAGAVASPAPGPIQALTASLKP